MITIAKYHIYKPLFTTSSVTHKPKGGEYMNNITKLSAAFGIAAVSMAFAGTAAFADTTDVVNTGNSVYVSGDSGTSTNVNVTNSNTANISQSSTSNVNTGNNDANRNIGDTSIDSGNASVTNAFSANANTNTTAISGLGAGSNDSTTLTNTGDDVYLSGFGGDSTNVSVVNANQANVSQSSNSNANTGHNDANRNIGDVSLQTGNAGVSNVFGTQVNGNQVAISLLGANNSSDSLDVVNTGDNVSVSCDGNSGLVLLFTQNSNCGDETNIEVVNANSASISQSTSSNVNTGYNDANRNIGLDGAGTDLSTGTAAVANVFSAQANGNVVGINGTGLFNGSSDVTEVTNTGDYFSVVGPGTSVETNVTVVNANTVSGSQSSNSNANTGENDTNRNIALSGNGTSLDSGNAGFTSAFLFGANWNWTGIGTMSLPSAWWML
jgi:hypothetical protein